jgi:glycine/D-amino acid oxidase-like deaminating enzyme
MRSTADVVVIGGGTNGTSTAFNLTLLGVRNVVLLERRQLAAGATGKSGALVRMHYTNETESRMAFESLKIFRNFGEAWAATAASRASASCSWSALSMPRPCPATWRASSGWASSRS